MNEKKVRKKRRSVRFKPLLSLIFITIAILPAFLQRGVLLGAFSRTSIETRRIEMQNSGLILVNKLSSKPYLNSVEKDLRTDLEIDNLADIYQGRIVIMDKSFRVIKDSFDIAEGKLNVSEEIIRCFRGESSDIYNQEKHFIIQTFPIYSLNEENSIEGVMLFTSSTENISAIREEAARRTAIFNAMLAVILAAFGIVIASVLVNPFERLKNALAKVTYGDMDHIVEEEAYEITREMSSIINATLSKLKQVDQSREDFVANVSHELKTPITSIRVLADSLMAMDEVPQELYKEFMNDISAEIDRESKIIDDLLALVKLDKSATQLNIEQSDINQLLKQIIKRLRPIAMLRNIDIILETIREVRAEVDETKLSLAFNNIIENAIKYNKEGGWVEVTLDADHKFFYVKVKDSGIGIAEEFQESIFERFYRIDKARSRETGGSGLGLSITKNIVLRHKGIIKVSGKEGEGTMFTVRIPLNYIVDAKKGFS
ncbi:MAG: HAMP domain-containing sensor histidine kinase [Johnsonella sp.]|nr:HAMP domain-containing sensor histidine kinase [Johnsonella sp.]